VRTDDEAAEFCRRARPELVGTLTLYCCDRHVAEDLAQQTLARVWASWGRVASTVDRRAYVHRMALNAARSQFRRRAAERRARQRLGGVVRRTPDEAPDHAAALVVRDAVAALPLRQRAAIVLRYFADLPVRDTAVVMGCAEGTVKALTFKAIAALRAQGLVDDEEHADA
jgi:RNA polymerase sigma-70 factor (sigma-E family)